MKTATKVAIASIGLFIGSVFGQNEINSFNSAKPLISRHLDKVKTEETGETEEIEVRIKEQIKENKKKKWPKIPKGANSQKRQEEYEKRYWRIKWDKDIDKEVPTPDQFHDFRRWKRDMSFIC